MSNACVSILHACCYFRLPSSKENAGRDFCPKLTESCKVSETRSGPSTREIADEMEKIQRYHEAQEARHRRELEDLEHRLWKLEHRHWYCIALSVTGLLLCFIYLVLKMYWKKQNEARVKEEKRRKMELEWEEKRRIIEWKLNREPQQLCWRIGGFQRFDQRTNRLA